VNIRAGIPPIISQLVMKLLSKGAEDRYQSAFGLKADLLCIQDFLKSARSPQFELGGNDHSGCLNMPSRLYGREEELEKIEAAVKQAVQGSREIMFISGDIGSGKSALIAESCRFFTTNSVVLLNGKFDMQQQAVPYFALCAAVKNYLSQVLLLNESELENLKNTILRKLGSLAGVLTELIPELKQLIGEQLPVPSLGPLENTNRLHYLLKKFFTAILRDDEVLFFVLEDLQWADSASLNFIEDFVLSTKIKNMLFLATYRENDLAGMAPLICTLDKLQRELSDCHELKIKDLNKQAVCQMLADMLQQTAGITELGQAVYQRTGGNLFFIEKLLRQLYDDGLLTFNFSKAVWQWDEKYVFNLEIDDNVREFMAGRVARLPAVCRELLFLASCFGQEFSWEKLAGIRGKTVKEIRSTLDVALNEDLLRISGDKCSFTHERILSVVYEMMPLAKREDIHLKAARELWKKSSEGEINEELFNIANHLMRSGRVFKSRDEKDYVIHLMYSAAKKAHLSAAYEAGFEYLNYALGLFQADCWFKDYERSFKIYSLAAEMAYLAHQYEQAHNYIREALDNVHKLREKAALYEIQMSSFAAQEKLQESVDTALKALETLGLEFQSQSKLNL
ncbi:MAG: AAA family ATPase, partial [Lentisphaeraceae bacterium]|nr:AAA family ATPase [Lentisphaeraceae bacterium]